jgi:DNA invertase Pin-like site-specific DNA recombinase
MARTRNSLGPAARAGTLTTALIYTRVSSDEQARGGVSLDAQLNECRQYVLRHGWVLGVEYQDVLSGKRDDRIDYQALLAEVRRLRATGQPVVVVTPALDRFGRRLSEQLRCREEFQALGVDVHFIREGGVVPEVYANVLASFAQEEVRRGGERVSAVRQHLMREGWHPGGRPAWGYCFRDATDQERAMGAPKRVLELDETCAPFVQEAYRRVAAGESVRAVATWVAQLPSDARGGRSMPYVRVLDMLRAAVYVARPHDGDVPVLDRPICHWPALVDDDTYRRVQEQIGRHKKLPRQATGRYLLSGLLRCPTCGERMCGWGMRERGPRYRCEAWMHGADTSDPTCHTAVLAAPVDAAVMADVSALIVGAATTDSQVMAALTRAWGKLQEPEGTTGLAAQMEELEREADKAKDALARAAYLFAREDFDKLAYDLARDAARRDYDAAIAGLAELRAKAEPALALPPLERVLANVGVWQAALDSADPAARREVLGVLIERITPVRVKRGAYRAEITWTPLGTMLHDVLASQPYQESAA